MEFRRGDIYYVEGTNTTGGEQRGNRPAIIVSNDKGNKYAPVVEVVYLTAQTKNRLPTHTEIRATQHCSTALCEQVTTVSKSRLKDRLGGVTEAEMNKVDKALKASLGIQETVGGDRQMQMTIKTPNGDMNFDMPQDKAMEIIQTAFRYAQERTVAAAEVRKPTNVQPRAEVKIEPDAAEIKVNRPRRRVETLFGDFRSGNTATATSTAATERTAEAPTEKRDYKGFLLIECEKCGTVKGFCAKRPITEHICACGHRTPLNNLRPAYLHCKCGSSYRYFTNFWQERFEYNCLNCGSPIDAELNGRRNAYVTISDYREAWTHDNKH